MCFEAIAGALGIFNSVKSLKSSSPAPAAVSAAPTTVDVTTGEETLESNKSAKKKAALAAGYQSTIKSGAAGVTSTANTNKKTLLGQ